MKLTLVYDAMSGYNLCDGRAEGWVDTYLDEFLKGGKNQRIVIGSALLIDFFRLRLCEGVIAVNQIEFVFDGKTLDHNEYGRIKHWPKGYCDIPIYPMERLLCLASDLAKKKKKWPKDVASIPNN